MTYIVTKNIIDTKDNDRLYLAGDTFPRPDFEVSAARLKELIDKGVIVSDDLEADVKPKRGRKKANLELETSED